MEYRVDLSPGASREIDRFLEGLRIYSFQTAEKYQFALQEMIDTYLVRTPTFFQRYPKPDGPFYRLLFKVPPRTTYWVEYRVFEQERIVRVIKFRKDD